MALIGDAASCISLLGGEGSALAMAAACILAGELRRANGDYVQAFSRYREIFAPFIRKKQRTALRFAGFFAPKSKVAIHLRNWLMNLLTVPWLADRIFGGEFSDRIALAEY